LGESVVTNNFLCEADKRGPKDVRFFAFDMPETSEYRVLQQELDVDVAPGQTWETFIGSEEGVTEMAGDWVWRLQFRKGYHPTSGRGITTLVDVIFNVDEVINES
jgi:hypothetical protein